ncbi:putative nb-arc and ankyrin domain protein [Botrytis fragariae]|uniref:Putative nb-arc and ankyrin domain protein n=1 Tax=Botrytis fragariae TaxID=1964551 RepID=A0A8H6AN22_9HELO|nr:putative nb-arc and ankyrin domain protein [Botrytis fragariae]KAF5870429.1 putative nb-arc and ankyrin domain protein [Botrytis fragariae]
MFYIDDVPKYAILLHTWGIDEITFQDLVNGPGGDKAGHEKLLFCENMARQNGLEYFWIDTCCIDISSSVERKEAINSMFRWYQDASLCCVYLEHVSAEWMPSRHNCEKSSEAQMRRSRWLTRGWTVLELLAPPVVHFFTREGKLIGSKPNLVPLIHEIAGIPISVIRSDIENRQATFEEDIACSMLGLFGVYMPLIYGERKEIALRRLREEIQKRRNNRAPRQTEPISPDISSQPLYSQPLGADQFRILRLEPGAVGSTIIGEVSEHNTSTHPQYYTLSYVWGQEPKIHGLMINGEARFIRPNLFHALQRMRLQAPIHIWVDSLCINQRDDFERNAQLSQMSTIYTAAIGVLIWLGEEDSTSKFAIGLVAKMTVNEFRWKAGWWEHYGIIGLARILERTWFLRGWVLQEAAFSRNSSIYCGSYGPSYRALDLVRANPSSTPPLFTTTVLANFHHSAAVRLLDNIKGAFEKSAVGTRTRCLLTLETLVELTTLSETTDKRGILDVFVDFILHSCRRSGSLDVICRPWAPISNSTTLDISYQTRQRFGVQSYPSWISSRDNLPFGNTSWRSNRRINGISLVSRNQKRLYNAHGGTKPDVHVGCGVDGVCNGSLHTKGIILGEIIRRSTRFADAILTTEGLESLGSISPGRDTNRIHVPDACRIICADRDDKGEPAPLAYEEAMTSILNTVSSSCGSINQQHPSLVIDIEELILNIQTSDTVKAHLKVVRDIVWNRRSCQLKLSVSASNKEMENIVVGLVPQNANYGDSVCILYGCSVPVVLRKSLNLDGEVHWQLVGEAYMDRIMNGEAIHSYLFEESLFKIR